LRFTTGKLRDKDWLLSFGNVVSFIPDLEALLSAGVVDMVFSVTDAPSGVETVACHFATFSLTFRMVLGETAASA
jgi:hypothetical protein